MEGGHNPYIITVLAFKPINLKTTTYSLVPFTKLTCAKKMCQIDLFILFYNALIAQCLHHLLFSTLLLTAPSSSTTPFPSPTTLES